LRTAHRIVFRLAVLALITSLFSGHSAMLDIVANILFAASIVLFVAAHTSISLPAPAQKALRQTFKTARALFCR
jgi:hypothetical protein